MTYRSLLAIIFFVSTTVLAGQPQYVDLSHDYSVAMPHWPGTEAFKITHQITAAKVGDVAMRDYASSEHMGTHMDAPNHFARGHSGIDTIPLSNLIGPAIKVDVSQQAKNNHDYLISIDDFQRWEATHGKIPPGTIVLLSTGFGQYWSQQEKYAGVNNGETLSTAHMHFPGLALQAAVWLVKERKIKAVGIDTFSIDYGQSKTFETHQFLTKNNIPIFENVASMKALPENHFTIYALPMKIKEGTGAPLRIIAQL